MCVCVSGDGVLFQVKVSKPTPEQLAILDVQFGEQKKAKEKKEDDTIAESTVLHGLCITPLTAYLYYSTHCIHVLLHSLHTCITPLHIYVAAPRQDSMSAASANAVLSGCCNRFVGYL